MVKSFWFSVMPSLNNVVIIVLCGFVVITYVKVGGHKLRHYHNESRIQNNVDPNFQRQNFVRAQKIWSFLDFCVSARLWALLSVFPQNHFKNAPKGLFSVVGHVLYIAKYFADCTDRHSFALSSISWLVISARSCLFRYIFGDVSCIFWLPLSEEMK